MAPSSSNADLANAVVHTVPDERTWCLQLEMCGLAQMRCV